RRRGQRGADLARPGRGEDGPCLGALEVGGDALERGVCVATELVLAPIRGGGARRGVAGVGFCFHGVKAREAAGGGKASRLSPTSPPRLEEWVSLVREGRAALPRAGAGKARLPQSR